MIGALAKLLGLNSLAAYAIVAVLAIALAGGAYWYVDHRGYERAAVVYEARIAAERAAAIVTRDKETERQDAANNIAKAREIARIAEMQAVADELQSKIEELQREADQDPDARRVAVDAPSVRRINEIRQACRSAAAAEVGATRLGARPKVRRPGQHRR